MRTTVKSVRPTAVGLCIGSALFSLSACNDASTSTEPASTVLPNSAAPTASTTGCISNERVDLRAEEVRVLHDKMQADFEDGVALGTTPHEIVELTESALVGFCESDAHRFCATAGMRCEVTIRDGNVVLERTAQSTVGLVWLETEGTTVVDAEVPWMD